ncbi:cell division protein FtsQ/DivIB [Actinomyces glycerinitolerans]|uniref:Polypeptide-transport-associated ftsq-type n=1 Tax=Actinomyces glycerinitolerans TaxID=1892869 RepID=A0A1M4S2U3_9ACTO|nr:FtsQ-type POTRA domain-containing protein [Actinomyces glycerinitolerans]SHE26470.1 polypeptide-transport-associated ftsq-type [Actinomyces glycerinitolerans]
MMRKPTPPRPRGPETEPEPDSAAAELSVHDDGGPALPVRGEHRDRVVSTGLTDRLDERRRARRRLRRGRLVRAVALVAALVLLGWGALFSPLLALRTTDITVTGADDTVDAAAVQQALADHAGQSLLRLNVGALGDEVADSLVRVKSAAVTRSWPHGLAVRLTLRVPVAARPTDAGYQVLDGEAVVLETVEQAPDDLAVIQTQPGQELSEVQVSAVTEAIGSLDADVRAQVAKGAVSDTGQVTLTLTGGATVVWGQSTDNELKARVLAVLLDQEAQTYDVSSPHSPTTS